jgi:hypothetical protein
MSLISADEYLKNKSALICEFCGKINLCFICVNLWLKN